MLALYLLFLVRGLDTRRRSFRPPPARRAAPAAAAILLPAVAFTPLRVGGVILFVALISLCGFAFAAALERDVTGAGR